MCLTLTFFLGVSEHLRSNVVESKVVSSVTAGDRKLYYDIIITHTHTHECPNADVFFIITFSSFMNV